MKESGEGVAGLVVAAYAELDAPSESRRRRLGSVVTDGDGAFTIDYEPVTGIRASWLLSLTISAPDDCASDSQEPDAPLATCNRRDPAPSETFHIRLASDKLAACGILSEPQERDAGQVIGQERIQRDFQAALTAESRRVLAERLTATHDVRQRASAHFDRFLSALSVADPERPASRFVPPGASIRETMLASVRDGSSATIKQMAMSTVATFTPNDLALLRERFGNDLTRIPAGALAEALSHQSLIPSLTHFVRLDPKWLCRQQVPLNDCVKILDPDYVEPPAGTDEPPPGDEPTVQLGLPPGGQAAETESAASAATIAELIGHLTATMTSPEEEVLFGVRPKLDDIQTSVDRFSLRSGPADVPATYDFHRLIIAFEPVWQELFDKGTRDTGLELFEKFVEVGQDPNAYLLDENERPKINLDLAKDTAALAEPDPRITEAFEITRQEWNVLDAAHQKRLSLLADKIYIAYREGIKQTKLLDMISGVLGASVIDALRRAYTEEATRGIKRYQAKGARIVKYAKEKLQEPSDFDHFHELLAALGKRLKEPYRFSIYAADAKHRSVNFGVLLTYRQKWTPVTYQVGELVKTVPLAPKETRKYSRKMVRKLSRTERESSSTLESVRTESSETVRAEAEIINKARTKTNFDVDAKVGVNVAIVKVDASTKVSEEIDKESQETKKEFREAVFKAATEYKSEHKLEVETGDSSEYSEEESGEISNPNDELPVTYLFYELQRRYRVDEKLHKATRVILVAQEFTDTIDEDWVVANDSMLRQHVLHPSMIPAMDYLATKIVGEEFALKEQYANLQQQRRIVDQLTDELTILRTQVSARYDALQWSMAARADAIEADNNEGFLRSGVDTMFGGFDADPEAMKAREDAARDAYERLARQEADLTDRVQRETAAVTEATEAYIKPLSEHLNRKAQIDRLLIHIRANLFHYMQAIYTHEPTDQRYFRLRDVQVPRLKGTLSYTISVDPDSVSQPPTWTKAHKLHASVDIDPGAIEAGAIEFDNLGDIADLDNLLGFRGNYMIFPLKEGNVLTDWMMAPYYDPFSGLRDPDQLADWTLHEFAEYVCCLKEHATKAQFDSYLPGLIETYRRLKEQANDDDELVIPTGSLYIEALPGAHPILEDFKLAHRAIDVKKVQAEVRLAELENVRMAARLLAGEREDPRIDKKIVIEGSPGVTVDPDDT